MYVVASESKLAILRSCDTRQPAVWIVIIPRDDSTGGIRQFPNAAQMIARKVPRHAFMLLATVEIAIHEAGREPLLGDLEAVPDQPGVARGDAIVLLDDPHAAAEPSQMNSLRCVP